jgi:hypothetical protein
MNQTLKSVNSVDNFFLVSFLHLQIHNGEYGYVFQHLYTRGH